MFNIVEGFILTKNMFFLNLTKHWQKTQKKWEKISQLSVILMV